MELVSGLFQSNLRAIPNPNIIIPKMSDTPYIVSARKYRPANFKSVVGQKNLTETLRHAIDSHRLAQAYLFCGPRGVGKTSCARIFAKTINCLSPTPDGDACGHCDSCTAFDQGNSFNIIELDAASNNSVDDIRDLTAQVNIPPTIGKYRVFIIDEVHMLSSQAFNAFLKTLEEPPAYVVFILATTEKHKVIPTILSRCQIYDFKRITIQDMVEHLQYVASQEGITADVASLNVIAKKADGAMRDALSIFDQVAASSFGNITYESTIASLNVLDYEYYFRLVDAFRMGDVPQALLIYKEIRDHGFDSLFFVNGLAAHVRDLMVAYSPSTASLLEVADDIAVRYSEQARQLPVEWHYAALRLLNSCDTDYRTSSNKQLLVELTLIRLCQLLNPPTPPFDRVDSDFLPLRDPATPPSAPAAYTPVASPAPAASIPPAATPTPVSTAPPSAAPAPPVSAAPSPVAAPPSAPAAASAEAAQAPAEAPRIVRGRRSQRPADSSDSSADAPASYERLRQSVSPEAFLAAWRQYIELNPDRHLLISAMRKEPVRISDETYKVIVDHPAMREEFKLAMPHLMEYLRSKLSNDYLSLEIEVDDSQTEKGLSPQELLKDIVEANPAMRDLIADLDAELA